VVLFVVSPLGGKSAFAAAYGGGSGTETDPYLIYTAEQMNAIGANSGDWDSHFVLTDDVNLAEFTGTQFNIIADPYGNHFVGVFDGNDHTISNFTYTAPDANFIGLFVCVGRGGEVGDLSMKDVSISGNRFTGGLVGMNFGTISNCVIAGTISGKDDTGGLTGRNYGMISDCSAAGSVQGEEDTGGLAGGNSGFSDGTISSCYAVASVDGNDGTGGLVGNNSGTISNCYATGSVDGDSAIGGLVGENQGLIYEGLISGCYATGPVSGYDLVGGLVGWNSRGTILDCYVTCSVEGDNGIGGLVGWNTRSTISNCYATGAVEGNNNTGGIVGQNSSSSIVTESFWDIESSGQSWSDGGTGKTTAQMQSESTFTSAGWDFATPIWKMCGGPDYPHLWWETLEAPVLHSEPEITLWASNTILWDAVSDANEYWAECGEDANFTSIFDSSGWIADTNCEFVELELGQMYWYRVKARTVSCIESGWSNVEASMQGTPADAVDVMLDPNSMKNENMKNALVNKIDAVLEMIDGGNYEGALHKLENDILQKTDGCVDANEPDKNDWIRTCEEQEQIYPLVIETIDYVMSLME